jgi:ribosomal-protein-alanine N-acetyltransferase
MGVPADVFIREAVNDDLPSILAIERTSASAAHWSEEQYRARIGAGDSVMVAGCNGRMCGFACVRVVAGEWEIENVVVGPEMRRKGIGAALVSALVERWEAAGGLAVLLEVRESNQAARALYEKCGFRECGRRSQYYRDPVEDAILYRRDRSA